MSHKDYVIMYKPKPDTVREVYGVDVFEKNEFKVPKNKVHLLKSFGYKVKEEKHHKKEK